MLPVVERGQVMSEVGALIIRLQAETAQFRSDMGKVKSDLKDLEDDSQKAGRSMDSSFVNARGGMLLTEQILGVRIPRAMNELLSRIPAVAGGFSTMLPIIGIVAAIAIVGRLMEKHEALVEAM